MTECVLDASALLALLNGESGAEIVSKKIPHAKISAVNLSETVGKLMETGMPESDVYEAIESLGMETIVFDEPLAYETGKLRIKTKKLGLSLGDRACLATAKKKSLPAITADRNWLKLKTTVRIQCIR